MEANTEIEDLHTRLAQVTEVKAPSSTAAPTWFAEDKDFETTSPTGTVTNASNVSSSDSDSNRNENQPGNQNNPEQKPTATAAKLPDAVVRASAETATLMYDQALTVGCTIAINSKFNKKFTDDEKKQILDKNLEDTPEEALLNEADKQLAAKWKRLNKKKARSLNEIPLSDAEEKRITEAFYNYFKIKNITMPPEYLLLFNLVFTTADRIVETIVD